MHLRDGAYASRLDGALAAGNGLHWERLEELTYRIRYDREEVSSADIIRRIVNEVPVRDLYVEPQPVEEIIKNIYSRGVGSGE